MQLAYPFHLDERGRIAEASPDEHVSQLIEQLLFTAPGQRVNRPTLGCGLIRQVFAPDNDELATANQFLVQGELQQWMGNLIQVQSVTATAQGDQLTVNVQYVVRSTQQVVMATFQRRRPPA